MTDGVSSRCRASIALAAVAALFLGVFAAPMALAAEHESEPVAEPTLLLIDAGDDPAFIVRTPSQPSRIDVAVNGLEVDAGSARSLGSAGVRVQTVIVIDNGIEAEEILPQFLAAAIDYVEAAPADEDISVWTTGGAQRLRVGLNDEHDRTVEILQNILTAAGTNRLWDGIRGAALGFDEATPGATNMIILAGSSDTESITTPADARAAVLATHASAFVVAVDGGDEIEEINVLGSLTRLAAATPGGAYAASDDPALISGYGSSISQVIASTWYVDYTDSGTTEGNQIEITLEGVSIRASFVPDAMTSGSALAPFIDGGRGGISFLEGQTGRTLAIVFGAAAAAMGAYAIVMIFQKDASRLHDTLEAYVAPLDDAFPEAEKEGAFGGNVLLRRAAEITEGIADRQGMLTRAEGMLERASLPLRAGEAFTAYGGIVLGSMAIGFLAGRTIIVALLFGLVAIIAPPAVVKFLAARRKKAFMAQLPDTLQLLSSTLKAGYSFMQGVEAVSQEVADPMGGELRRIVTEAQLGRPLEDAMDSSAERMGSPDFAWAVMAVKIQREVGGNLAELLLTVSETMTARERLRRDVAALTAEGKMSAMVLGALPILLGFAMWVMNPEYIGTLFEETVGRILLVASVVAALVGFAWMKKIINIDI